MNTGGAVVEKTPVGGAARRISRRPKSEAMPPRTWSPRQQVQHLNDFISLGTLDRPDFWLNFVISFWTETPVALRLYFPSALSETSKSAANGNTAMAVGEGGGTVQEVEKFDIPYSMLAYFFHVWASNTTMRRLHFEVPQATEGQLPNGAAFLTSVQSSIETVLLDGSLLIRQHARTRFIFDSTGRITLMEWHIHNHDEYFLSLRAAHLMTANFSANAAAGMVGERQTLCRSGFPSSVHRMLEIHAVLEEIMGPELIMVRGPPSTHLASESHAKAKRRRKPHSC